LAALPQFAPCEAACRLVEQLRAESPYALLDQLRHGKRVGCLAAAEKSVKLAILSGCAVVFAREQEESFDGHPSKNEVRLTTQNPPLPEVRRQDKLPAGAVQALP
jgi:hypothetical protein